VVTVRRSTADDASAIRAVLLDAFPTASEADLVDGLRAGGDLLAEWVAQSDGAIIGCVQYSPLILRGAPEARAAALAPVAVASARQGVGVGSSLIRDSLASLASDAIDTVVVLGDPDYYARFGFSAEIAASTLRDPFDAGAAFMVLETRPDVLDRRTRATPVYAKAFGLNQA